MLGHGALIGALGAGEADAALPSAGRGAYWSVPALIDWMKRSRPAFSSNSLRQRPETSSTSASADPALELSRRAELEARDARLARQEPLLEPIGDMGEADGQAVLGRQHRALSPSTSRH